MVLLGTLTIYAKRALLIDGFKYSLTSCQDKYGNYCCCWFSSPSSKTIKRIAEAKKDIKEGNVCTLEEIKAEFGLEW